MKVRICTFNAWQRANQLGFDFLQRRVKPDVVLLQEAKKAAWPGVFMPLELTDGANRPWATGIWTRPAVKLEPLPSESGVPGRAARIVLRECLLRLTISLIDLPSTRCIRLISAHRSTSTTLFLLTSIG